MSVEVTNFTRERVKFQRAQHRSWLWLALRDIMRIPSGSMEGPPPGHSKDRKGTSNLGSQDPALVPEAPIGLIKKDSTNRHGNSDED